MLPYLLSILALVVMARAAYPQALMKPYRRANAKGCRPPEALRASGASRRTGRAGSVRPRWATLRSCDDGKRSAMNH